MCDAKANEPGCPKTRATTKAELRTLSNPTPREQRNRSGAPLHGSPLQNTTTGKDGPPVRVPEISPVILPVPKTNFTSAILVLQR